MFSQKRSMVATCSLSIAISMFSQTAALSLSSVPLPLEFQNKDVKALVDGGVDTAASEAPISKVTLEKIINELSAHGTLSLRRYSSGGQSAVTIHDPRSLESAVDGMLVMHWDRDNIMQVLAEYQLAGDDELRVNLKVAKGAWLLGLLASLKHHYNYYHRFTDIIDGKAGAHDYSKRPHIRYNPINLQEVQDPWGHAQNDALGSLLFMTFYAANQGKLTIAQKALAESTDGKQPKPLVAQREAYRLGVLLPLFFEKIEVWKDFDFGGWEDKKAEHASSIACALAALREEKKYVERNGPLAEKIDGKDYVVNSELLSRLIKECELNLAKILPNEFINSDPEDKRADASRDRTADSALLDPLLLAAVSGEPIINDAMTEKILDTTIKTLGRPIGFARYQKDIWDGRVDRRDLKDGVEEAQWSHMAPMISVIYGELYRKTKRPEFLRQQEFFFRRSLTTINKRWRIPEAYIVDQKTRSWVSDANEPLAWAQSAEILAIIGMKKSLDAWTTPQKP